MQALRPLTHDASVGVPELPGGADAARAFWAGLAGTLCTLCGNWLLQGHSQKVRRARPCTPFSRLPTIALASHRRARGRVLARGR